MSQDGAGKFPQGFVVFCEEIRRAHTQDNREGYAAEDEAMRKKFDGRLMQRNTRRLKWNCVMHKFHHMKKDLPMGYPLDHTQKQSHAAR